MSGSVRLFLNLVCLAAGLGFARADQPPSSAEQQTYQAAEQAVVDAINTYRQNQTPPLPLLTPLIELCGGARLEAEARLTNPTAQISRAQAEALGFTGNFIGFVNGGFYLSANALLTGIASDSNIRQYLLDPSAKYVGVGVAVRTSGQSSDVEWAITIARDGMGAAPYGTSGIEMNSGRGLPDLTKIDAILSGAISGDSITGYVYDPDAVILTPAVVEKFNKALKKLLKSPPVIRVAVGQPVAFKLPPDVFKVVKKLTIKGKLPPGVKFDRKKGRLRGAPSKAGSYVLRIKAGLKAEINGLSALPLIKLRINVGG
jgi:hypothetical protein